MKKEERSVEELENMTRALSEIKVEDLKNKSVDEIEKLLDDLFVAIDYTYRVDGEGVILSAFMAFKNGEMSEDDFKNIINRNKQYVDMQESLENLEKAAKEEIQQRVPCQE